MNLRPLKRHLLAALLAANVLGGIALANPVIVPDFSFENTQLDDGTNSVSPYIGTNWTAAGNGGIFLGNPQDDSFLGATGTPGTLPFPADGTNCLFMNLGSTGYVWQDLGPLQSNTVYTLTVAVGRTLTSSGGIGQIGLVNGVNAFGTLLAATPVDTTGGTPGAFADSTLVFTTGRQVSGHLTILLQGFQDGAGTQLVFDNVRLDATPTPQTPTTFVPSASPGTTVYIGTQVTFSENPAGAAPFHYQWLSDNGSGGSIFGTVVGATNSSYTVDTTSFTAGSEFQYEVIVMNSLGSSTSAPVVLDIIDGPPVIVTDTLPTTGADVVGSQATFAAVMDGSRPIGLQWQVDTGSGPTDIPGATNSTLTLTNLQVTDTGVYSLTASNILGVTSSTGSLFIVNPTPTPTNNVLASVAAQTGFGGSTWFHPNWTVATNSLIEGYAPSNVGTGNFNDDASGTVSVLTDGALGLLFPAGNGSIYEVTCGTVGGGAGTSVTYTLPASTTGYDLTNIVVYGGWSDAGRDQQRYLVFYSTVASPNTFNQLASVNYNPSNPNALQSATRVTLTSATTDPLAKNVAAVKFDFTVLDQGVENGYAGYSEIGLFGVPSAPAPVVATNTLPVTASDVVGSSITFRAAFGSATPVTYQWMVDNGSGPAPIPGATNTILVLTNLQFTDSASPGYSLQASNSSGVASSSASALVVNPAPSPDANNILVSPANQTGSGSTFSPTWTITPGSLIAGALPSAVGSGVFTSEGAGGLAVLTDGVFGSVGSGINTSLVTCGSGAGQSVTYTLNGPASGFDITNIVTYGGWSDRGRDQQAYTVTYSTVLAPTTFLPLTVANFNPPIPGSIPSADRVTITSAAGGPVATNVAQIKFDYTTPGVENGYVGVAEIDLYGAPSAPLPIPAYVTLDTLPVTGSDVVGSSVTFKAAFNGTAPIGYQWMVDNGGGPVPIPGATNTSLTLTNLQLSDGASPGYSLQGSNVFGVASSSERAFVVNPVPSPNANGVIASPANQTGSGAFTPTWVLAPGSLIAGFAPSSVGSGTFTLEGAGGTPVLTDGLFGSVGAGNSTLATCGSGSGGHSLTYTLTGSASGYTLTNIISYAGWNDNGRDQQAYTVSYSTVASPATFITIAAVNYNPAIPGVPSADRVTLTPATATPLAANAGQVKFSFTSPAGENGYSGYAEFDVYGFATPSTTPPTVNPPILAGGNLILTGSGGMAGGSYTVLTSTNLAAPVSTWTTNTTGLFSGSGSYSNAIPVTASEPTRFFRIRIP